MGVWPWWKVFMEGVPPIVALTHRLQSTHILSESSHFLRIVRWFMACATHIACEPSSHSKTLPGYDLTESCVVQESILAIGKHTSERADDDLVSANLEPCSIRILIALAWWCYRSSTSIARRATSRLSSCMAQICYHDVGRTHNVAPEQACGMAFMTYYSFDFHVHPLHCWSSWDWYYKRWEWSCCQPVTHIFLLHALCHYPYCYHM